MTSRSSTEWLGTLTESVVFHVVSWMSFWVVLVLCWLGFCLLFVFLCCFDDT